MPEETQNTGPEVSELQMMAESQTNPETQQENSNNNQSHTGRDTHLIRNVHSHHVKNSLPCILLAQSFRFMLFYRELISRRCIKPQALEKLIIVDFNLDLCAPLGFTIDYNNSRNDDNAVININLSYINFLE